MSEEELEEQLAKLKAIEQRKASVLLGVPPLDSVEELLASFEPVSEALLSHVGYNTLLEFTRRVHNENQEVSERHRERLTEQENRINELTIQVGELNSKLARLTRDFSGFAATLTTQNQKRISLLSKALSRIFDAIGE